MEDIKERAMVVAHKIGRDHAKLAFEILKASSTLWFKSGDERDSFIAGYIGELRRLATTDVPPEIIREQLA